MKKNLLFTSIGALIVVIGLGVYQWHQERRSNTNPRMTMPEQYQDYAVATFAGGCFWCTESDFEKTVGVVEAISGYTGGHTQNPTYKQTNTGTTGHREAVQVFFDPEKVSYEQLLDVFWRHHDPTDGTGSFADRGFQYSTAIFVHSEEQKQIAQESKATLDASGVFDEPVATPILEAAEFFVAEDYHQDYHTKNPTRYGFYRNGSGRNDYIQEVWGDELKKAQELSLEK